MPSSVKKQILKITNRKYGLNIQSDALDYLDELLSSIDEQDILKTIDRIAQAYLQQQGTLQTTIESDVFKKEVLLLIWKKFSP